VPVMPHVRLQNNSSLASNPSKLATAEKIRAGVTQFLQPGGEHSIDQVVNYERYREEKRCWKSA
jgi:hypothetical protein